ncbi:hypothetical protein PYK79_49355 [Streptomyces sp. ID05-04B]|nr:hypothetical protein [Streptomyces sp. ID05-04B]
MTFGRTSTTTGWRATSSRAVTNRYWMRYYNSRGYLFQYLYSAGSWLYSHGYLAG